MSKKGLVLWHGGSSTEDLQSAVLKLKEEWNSKGTEIFLEHVERLVLASYPDSYFDVALCGAIPPPSFIHGEELLEELVRIMKPSGSLILKEPVSSTVLPLRTPHKLLSTVKFAGFVEVEQSSDMAPVDNGVMESLRNFGVDVQEGREEVAIATVCAKTPAYQSGASSFLSFGSRTTIQPQAQSNVTQIWSLSASDTVEDDLELLDSDTLLTDEDLTRPDPTSLRSACGPGSGKRKACKNCTCGLADGGGGGGKTTVTSSCGNCYLGDAFRCASCPYLGMPAFKPGEQVKLTDRQLHPDQ